MTFIVEMARGMPDTPEFASYSCGKNAWHQFLSVAKAFGWVPQGAIPDPYAAQRNKDYARCFSPTYDPEEWAYCKRLDDADAQALSFALLRAASSVRGGNSLPPEPLPPTLLREDLGAIELRRVNQPASKLLEEFARFAGGGGFAFAWDD